MAIRGTNPRFILGSYICEASRVAWNMSADKVEYSVKDQYKDEYTRKIGNRYSNAYEIFDFTPAEKTLLLGYNGTRQTFTQYFDGDCDKTVYCDIYYDAIAYYPTGVIKVVLTDLDVTAESTKVYGDSGRTEVKTDGYLKFDGTDDYVDLPTSLNDLGNKFTISFWYNTGGVDISTFQWIFGHRDGDPAVYVYMTTSGRIAFELRKTNGVILQKGEVFSEISANGNVNTNGGTWRNVICAFDSTLSNADDRMKIYMDGIDVTDIQTTVEQNAEYNISSGNFNIGSYHYLTTRQYFYGRQLRNFIMKKDAFTAQERADFIAEKFNAITNIEAWYRGNDADAGAPWTGNVADSSGNGNHATPVNIDGATFFNRT